MSDGDSTPCLLPLVGKRAEGVQAKVDPDVFFWAKNLCWFVDVRGYVSTRTGARTVVLHRLLMDNPKGLDVDHINGDKADNRRANLRAVTRQQNIRNSGPRRRAASRYKGVTLHKRGKWNARIVVNGRNLHLGLFVAEEAAAKAYDAAALAHFGEYAWLNFPPEGYHEQSRAHSKTTTFCE